MRIERHRNVLIEMNLTLCCIVLHVADSFPRQYSPLALEFWTGEGKESRTFSLPSPVYLGHEALHVSVGLWPMSPRTVIIWTFSPQRVIIGAFSPQRVIIGAFSPLFVDLCVFSLSFHLLVARHVIYSTLWSVVTIWQNFGRKGTALQTVLTLNFDVGMKYFVMQTKIHRRFYINAFSPLNLVLAKDLASLLQYSSRNWLYFLEGIIF